MKSSVQKYKVSGMSCAACQNAVERAVSKVDGVSSCSVSLLMNEMSVEGTASQKEIEKAVEKAGYKAYIPGDTSSKDNLSANSDSTTKRLLKRLISSIIVLLVLMYFSMGHHMFGFPVPPLFSTHVNLGITEMLLTIIILVINKDFFISGGKSLLHLSPNMDSLVATGSSAAFIYSLAALYMELPDYYFETSAMIVTFVTIGKTLEAYSKGRTTDALKGLIDLSPKTAVIEENGVEKEIPVSELKEGALAIVRPGSSIPCDGIIEFGSTAVNESALTGESVPVDKSVGDTVHAATMNENGFIKVRAKGVGDETLLSKIINLVSDASATKAPIARIADKVAGVFVPVVMLIALATLIGWLIAGADFSIALSRAISVLVISCPCALGLATPVAVMVGNGVGAKNAILFKTASALEEAGKTCVAAIDKTGTITKGEPKVTSVIPAEGVSRDALLTSAFVLEKKSSHPLAKAITAFYENIIESEEKSLHARNRLSESVSGFTEHPGNGITGVLNNEKIVVGNRRFVEKYISLPDDALSFSSDAGDRGSISIFVLRNNEYLGQLILSDEIKEDSAEAVADLKNLGVKTIMLTGDGAGAARYIGKTAGVDLVIAKVLPSDKEKVIRDIKESNVNGNVHVAMAGDGINDAPALARADSSFAIGSGTDIAIDSAEIVLMKNSLSLLPAAIRLSRAVLLNIKENLFWAFFYNALFIPLAAGVYQALFGFSLEMSPAAGALAMSLSSVTVCLNALRLNLVKPFDKKHDRPKKGYGFDIDDFSNNEWLIEMKEKEIKMEKTMTIEGMMCAHCEKNVKNALEAINGVSSADVSHEKGEALVHLSSEVSDEVLKKAVEEKDYKVMSIA